jgi:hypothetical protein
MLAYFERRSLNWRIATASSRSDIGLKFSSPGDLLMDVLPSARPLNKDICRSQDKAGKRHMTEPQMRSCANRKGIEHNQCIEPTL